VKKQGKKEAPYEVVIAPEKGTNNYQVTIRHKKSNIKVSYVCAIREIGTHVNYGRDQIQKAVISMYGGE
jgi:hypothetical protein